jgi:hypothetical protein
MAKENQLLSDEIRDIQGKIDPKYLEIVEVT